ncbi:DUF2937 family protein [Alteromonas gilva]|uniref:DUF2937 family protein n=1 Tax=Alteromonas gilva TaxID=2987522 RepID=A0ABT5L5L3_9ALTE|nr:DUF2937 family protein [Alteromonas gilva]MDC8831776.1 DUF2937 family protein [Alteromonas gilva]
MIIIRLVDKVLFAGLFILLLQVPVVTEHYLQHLNGFVDATNSEVRHYQTLADDYGYASTDKMIETLLRNTDPLIRDDAAHKQQVIEAHETAMQALAVLRQSNYFEQAWFFAQPGQYDRLGKVLTLYQPSLPLHLDAVGSALITTVIIYLMLALPITLRRRKQRHLYRPLG